MMQAPKQKHDPNATILYLRQALDADRQIDALLDRAQRYMDMAARATSRTTALHAGGAGARSRVEDGIVALVDLSREVEQKANEMAAKVREVERVIDSLREPRHREILRLRYLNGWKWERIGEHLGELDRTWVWRLHGRALMEVEGVRGEGDAGAPPRTPPRGSAPWTPARG